MLEGLQHQAKQTALSFSIGVLGGTLSLVGLALLSVAGWIALAATTDHLTAALVIGLAYLGVGIILLAFARERPGHKAHSQRPNLQDTARQDPYAGVMAAFLEGFSAGSSTRRPH